MKKTYAVGMMVGLLALPGIASAEMITGTVTNIDPSAQKITLMRSDTSESLTVKVKDANALTNLQAGGNVTLDANPRLFGGWKAETVAASTSASASQNPDLNANAQEPSGQAPPSHAVSDSAESSGSAGGSM